MKQSDLKKVKQFINLELHNEKDKFFGATLYFFVENEKYLAELDYECGKIFSFKSPVRDILNNRLKSLTDEEIETLKETNVNAFILKGNDKDTLLEVSKYFSEYFDSSIDLVCKRTKSEYCICFYDNITHNRIPLISHIAKKTTEYSNNTYNYYFKE